MIIMMKSNSGTKIIAAKDKRLNAVVVVVFVVEVVVVDDIALDVANTFCSPTSGARCCSNRWNDLCINRCRTLLVEYSSILVAMLLSITASI